MFVLDSDSLASAALQSAITSREALVVAEPARASVTIARNPWAHTNELAIWHAVRAGAWVVTPTTFIKCDGPAIKYRSALQTPRRVWVSGAARDAHPHLWILILESLLRHDRRHRWKLLGTAEADATTIVS